MAQGRLRALAAGAFGTSIAAMKYREAICDSEQGQNLLQQKASAIPKLFCWGRLVPGGGDATVKIKEKSPVDVSFWASKGLLIQHMTMGERHGAVLDERGGLWVWGEKAGPVPVHLQGRTDLKALASTKNDLLAVTKSGTVLIWRDVDALLSKDGASAAPIALQGALKNIAAARIAAGDSHLVVIGHKGEVVVMGDNSFGQLGMGSPDTVPMCEQPTRLAAITAKATQAACGSAHTVILLDDGSCLSFGDDRNLQLGLRVCSIKEMRSGVTKAVEPKKVKLLGDRKVTAVACGGGGIEGGHSVFLTRGEKGDELWACGYGRWGQLGIKSYAHISEPKEVTTLSKLREWDDASQQVRG